MADMFSPRKRIRTTSVYPPLDTCLRRAGITEPGAAVRILHKQGYTTLDHLLEIPDARMHDALLAYGLIGRHCNLITAFCGQCRAAKTGKKLDPASNAGVAQGRAVGDLPGAGSKLEGQPMALEPEDRPVLFHGPSDDNFEFSNWFPSPLEYDGIHFSSAEQALMYSKAFLIGNQETMQEILDTHSPSDQQRLGRGLPMTTTSLQSWEARKFRTLANILFCKFGQNESLRSKLLNTGDRPLAEASASDNIYGIGVAITDPSAQQPSCWRGSNLLGKTLEFVRAALAATASLLPTPTEDSDKNDAWPSIQSNAVGADPESDMVAGRWEPDDDDPDTRWPVPAVPCYACDGFAEYYGKHSALLICCDYQNCSATACPYCQCQIAENVMDAPEAYDWREDCPGCDRLLISPTDKPAFDGRMERLNDFRERERRNRERAAASDDASHDDSAEHEEEDDDADEEEELDE